MFILPVAKAGPATNLSLTIFPNFLLLNVLLFFLIEVWLIYKIVLVTYINMCNVYIINIYIYIFLFLILFPYRVSQNIEHSYLC